jgi:hypothetical protein
MKRILSIIVLMLCVSVVFGQVNKTVRNSSVYNVKGGTGDTLNLGSTDSYKIYVQNFATKLKVGVELDSISGDPAIQTIIRTSLNFVDWLAVDTVLTTDQSNYVISDLVLPYTQYIEIESKGITNAQTSRFKYNILIEKNE